MCLEAGMVFRRDAGSLGVAPLPWIARRATAFLNSNGGEKIFLPFIAFPGVGVLPLGVAFLGVGDFPLGVAFLGVGDLPLGVAFLGVGDFPLGVAFLGVGDFPLGVAFLGVGDFPFGVILVEGDFSSLSNCFLGVAILGVEPFLDEESFASGVSISIP